MKLLLATWLQSDCHDRSSEACQPHSIIGLAMPNALTSFFYLLH